MSKLVAVKRMDKTGKLVTRHVRADKVQNASSDIPAPANPPAAPHKVTDPGLARRIRRLDARVPMTFRRDNLPIRANPRLEPWFREVYSMSTTGNELYSLLEKLTVDDAIVMAAAGVNSKNVDAFIRKQKWEVIDNTGIVSQLRARGVDARDYIEVALEDSAETASVSAILDAAEVKTLYNDSSYADRFGPRNIYSSYLINEQINMVDLKELGQDHCADTEHFGRVLLRLKSGKSVCTVRELRKMLDRAEKKGLPNHIRQHERIRITGSRALLAAGFGIDIAEKTTNTPVVNYAGNLALDRDCTREQALEFCEFINGLITNDYASHIDQYSEVDMWFAVWREPHEAGVSNDRIVEGQRQGLSDKQIIEANTEGVPLSITGGWL